MQLQQNILDGAATGAVAVTSGALLGMSGDILFGSFAGALAARVLATSGSRPKDAWAWGYAALCMCVAILLGSALAGILAEWFLSFEFIHGNKVYAERAAGVVVAAGAQAIVEAIQLGPRALLSKWVGSKEQP
jgi:hypothetical protein